jgi:hypothetical protein
MKKLLLSGALTAVVLAAAPAAAQAATIDDLARAECREERTTDHADYVRDYGTGKAAFRRCVTDQKRDARRECRADRTEDAAEFRAEYGGTGKAALKRCVRDELR